MNCHITSIFVLDVHGLVVCSENQGHIFQINAASVVRPLANGFSPDNIGTFAGNAGDLRSLVLEHLRAETPLVILATWDQLQSRTREQR